MNLLELLKNNHHLDNDTLIDCAISIIQEANKMVSMAFLDIADKLQF